VAEYMEQQAQKLMSFIKAYRKTARPLSWQRRVHQVQMMDGRRFFGPGGRPWFPIGRGLVGRPQNRLTASRRGPPSFGSTRGLRVLGRGVTLHGHDADAMFFQYIHPHLRR